MVTNQRVSQGYSTLMQCGQALEKEGFPIPGWFSLQYGFTHWVRSPLTPLADGIGLRVMKDLSPIRTRSHSESYLYGV